MDADHILDNLHQALTQLQIVHNQVYEVCRDLNELIVWMEAHMTRKDACFPAGETSELYTRLQQIAGQIGDR